MIKIFKIILTIFFGILILTTFFVTYEALQLQKNKILDHPSLAEARKIFSNLNLKQKIGQLFIIGFDGKILTPEIESLIIKIHPGGIILLQKNIENEHQLKKLTSSLQEIAIKDTGLPLFITVDQEGGLISRVEWVENMSQSAITDKEEAYQIGKKRGEELKELGVNVNLAPLLDAVVAGDFIFDRSFQKNPEEIGELSRALICGQKEAGIFTAIKHFPGYVGIPFNPEEKLATLEEIPEISQFQKAVEVEPEMIMTSNVIYKDLDEDLPFTFLPKGIQFLKSKIKGDYLIVSDDLAQNSLLDRFTLKEIVTLPLKAGIDILGFSGWKIPAQKGVLELYEAVENGEISEEIINQSVLKIIKFKQKLIE
jgi:beta-N-acetylhexosaminidase